MTEKKKSFQEINATTSTYLMKAVDLPAGKYTKARLLDIIFGFDKEIDWELPSDPTPKAAAAPPSLIPVTVPNADDTANLLAWGWPKDVVPLGVPCIRLIFAVFAWVRADADRLAKVVASLHSDGKNPKLKKSLSDFADVMGKLPISDSARWLFTVIHTGDVTSVKTVHEAIAQINGSQLVADLWKWGLSYPSLIHGTDAALAASMNEMILNICRGDRVDKSGSDTMKSHDINDIADEIEARAASTAGALMTTGVRVRVDQSTGLTEVSVPAKEPDAIIEPLGFGPPGDDLVAVSAEPGAALHRETDVQKNVTSNPPASEYDLIEGGDGSDVEEEDQENGDVEFDAEPKPKLAGSASAVIRALRDGFQKLGAIKAEQLADKMAQMTEPSKAVSAVVKLLTMVNEAENGALLAQMVEGGYVQVPEIESVFRDNWTGLYTSLCSGLRTTGPRPPWINDGLLAQKTA